MSLTEQEILQDLLNAEKHCTSSYNTFILEANCTNLRQELKNIWADGHTIHEGIYTIMNQKGWYPTSSDAPDQEVQKAKTTYNNMQV